MDRENPVEAIAEVASAIVPVQTRLTLPGAFQVPSPNHAVVELALVPEFRWDTARFPPTPPLPEAARLTCDGVMVPDPVGAREAPVPTSMAAVVLVPEVSAVKVEPPDGDCQFAADAEVAVRI